MFTRVFWTSTKIATEASTADSSSTASTVIRRLPPAPPWHSGMSIPMSPSSKHLASRAGSTVEARSIAATRGRTSRSAKSRTVPRNSSSSSDSLVRGVVDVAADGATAVTLATPGPATAHRTLCPHDPWHQKTGAILGLVRNAADSKPLPDIMVTAHWTIYVLGAGSVRAEPGTVAARSDGSGRVLLCNVPTDVEVVLQGKAGDGPAGMVLVDLAGRAFGRAALDLAVAATTGAVTGVVRNRNGSVIPGATVVAIGTDSRTQADELGAFTLREVMAGPRIVEAHAIGYPPGRAQTTVRPGLTQRVEIVVGDSISVLDPVTVEGRYEPFLTRIGFARRRNTALGHFLDTTDILRTRAVQFEEVFRMVPGVQLRPNGSDRKSVV